MPKGSAGGFGGGPQAAFGGRGFGDGPSPQFRPPGFDGGPSPQFQPPGMLGPPVQAPGGLGQAPGGLGGGMTIEDGPGSGFADRMPPMAPPSGNVDAGYGVGPLDAQGQQAPGPQIIQPPPSMPAGIPPQPPTVIPPPTAPGSQRKPPDRVGGAPVNGAGPAKIGMSGSMDAQQKMMQRAGVTPLGMQPQRKPAPVSKVPPKPLA